MPQPMNNAVNTLFAGSIGALVGAGIASSVIVNLDAQCGIGSLGPMSGCSPQELALVWQVVIYGIGASLGAAFAVWIVSVWRHVA
jgi:hypothetical protein